MNRFSLFFHRSIHQPLRFFSDNIIVCGAQPAGKIHLTFDDGPHPGNTPKLLHLLNRFVIPATFFLTGKCVASMPELAEEISQQGHIVGNHGWSHQNMRFHSAHHIRQNIQHCHDYVADLSGFRYIFRPPFGAWNPALFHVCKSLNYAVVFWSYSAADYNFRYWQKKDLAGELINRVRPGDILLLHDGYARAEQTIGALMEAIPYWQDCGFTFGDVTELLQQKKLQSQF